MKRVYPLLLLLGAPLAANAEVPVALDSSMESAISSYWPSSSKAAVSRLSEYTPEQKIAANHWKAVDQSVSGKTLKAKGVLSSLMDRVTKGKSAYKRVSCGATTCEIVLVFPSIDGESEEAKAVINAFYDSLLTRSATYKNIDPSMILEGSDTSKGFTIVHYVELV